MRFLNFNPELDDSFEIGARLIAVLAFPGRNEEQAMRRAAAALCADQIRITVENNPDSDATSQYSHHLGLTQKEVRAAVRTVRRRLQNRMVAARIARAFFYEATYKAPSPLPDTMARLSLNELCKLVLPESGESDSENIEKRTWRLSLPVIHLASAFSLFGEINEMSEIAYDIQALNLHRKIVALACQHEAMIMADRRFGVNTEDLVRLRWIE